MQIDEYIQLSVIYISTDAKLINVVQKLQETLAEELQQIIIGDFNFSPEEDNHLTKYFKSKGFIQMIDQPTHSGGRTIDHCYVSNRGLVQQIKIISPYYTDHSAFCMKLNR